MDNPTAEIHNHTRRLDKTPHPRHAPTDSALPERAPVTAEHRPARLEIPSHRRRHRHHRSRTRYRWSTRGPTGWEGRRVVHRRSPHPGEVGPAIIAGHVDWQGTDGVFFDLRNLETGADIIVTREDGSRAVFTATSVEHFPKRTFPPTSYMATSTTPDSGSSRAVDPSTKPHAVTTTTSSHSQTWPNRLRRRSTPLRKSARTVGEQ